MFFFINLYENEEIELLRSNGINNTKITVLISLVSLITGLILIIFYYSFILIKPIVLLDRMRLHLHQLRLQWTLRNLPEVARLLAPEPKWLDDERVIGLGTELEDRRPAWCDAGRASGLRRPRHRLGLRRDLPHQVVH